MKSDQSVQECWYSMYIHSVGQPPYDWWGRGLLAFRCLGITPGESVSTVHLPVRWMEEFNDPKNEIDMDISSESDFGLLENWCKWPPSVLLLIAYADMLVRHFEQIRSRGLYIHVAAASFIASITASCNSVRLDWEPYKNPFIIQ